MNIPWTFKRDLELFFVSLLVLILIILILALILVVLILVLIVLILVLVFYLRVLITIHFKLRLFGIADNFLLHRVHVYYPTERTTIYMKYFLIRTNF